MAPEIETFEKPAEGVAITWTGEAGPVFVVPFPGQTLVGAFARDAGSVFFVGSRNHRGGSGHPGTTLLARYEREKAKIVRRGEIDGLKARGALASRDGRAIFVSAREGFAVVDAVTLDIERRVELLRFDGDEGSTSSWHERDGGGPQIYEMNSKRWGPEFAGWQSISVQFGFQVSEAADGNLVHVERWMGRAAQHPGLKEQCFHVVDWHSGTVRKGLVRSQVRPTVLDQVDLNAELLHVTQRQVALFHAAPPQSLDRAGSFACPDPAEHAVVLHLWPLDRPDAVPTTLAVRTATRECWATAVTGSSWWYGIPENQRGELLNPLDQPSPRAEVELPRFWATAASHLLRRVFEDPRDGLVWLSFADDHIRSLDGAGELGPLIALGGTPNVPDDDPYRNYLCPSLSFQGEDLIVVRVHGRSYGQKMARYVFRASDMAGRTEPVTLTPAKSGPLPGSHAKAFSTWLRQSRRDRFALPDWSRNSVAAALEAQRAAVAAGLPDLVDPEEDRLTFSYKVAGKPLKEPAFFRRIVKEALPVVPELRALLTAYTDQLGTGGEGVQPWQDPDEGVGGLGPALRALALLDPDCLGVLRAYLETRDGEHEGYCLDVVVPAYLDRHGWRDAGTVRFGIYAVLNRFWGGRHPYGLDGLREAMAELSTPEDVAATVLQEAEHFGRKPDRGHDAAAYRAAFRALLNPALPFEAAVLRGLREADPPTEATPDDDP